MSPYDGEGKDGEGRIVHNLFCVVERLDAILAKLERLENAMESGDDR